MVERASVCRSVWLWRAILWPSYMLIFHHGLDWSPGNRVLLAAWAAAYPPALECLQRMDKVDESVWGIEGRVSWLPLRSSCLWCGLRGIKKLPAWSSSTLGLGSEKDPEARESKGPHEESTASLVWPEREQGLECLFCRHGPCSPRCWDGSWMESDPSGDSCVCSTQTPGGANPPTPW